MYALPPSLLHLVYFSFPINGLKKSLTDCLPDQAQCHFLIKIEMQVLVEAVVSDISCLVSRGQQKVTHSKFTGKGIRKGYFTPNLNLVPKSRFTHDQDVSRGSGYVF